MRSRKTLITATATALLAIVLYVTLNISNKINITVQREMPGSKPANTELLCEGDNGEAVKLISGDMRPEVAINKSTVIRLEISKVLIDRDIVCVFDNKSTTMTTTNSENYEVSDYPECIKIRWKYASSPRISTLTLINTKQEAYETKLAIGYEYNQHITSIDRRLWRTKGALAITETAEGTLLRNSGRASASTWSFKRATGAPVRVEITFVALGSPLNFGIILGDKISVVFGDGNLKTFTLSETKIRSNSKKGKSTVIAKKTMPELIAGVTYKATFSESNGEYMLEFGEAAKNQVTVFKEQVDTRAFQTFDNPGLIIFPKSKGVLVKSIQITVDGK